MSNFNHLLPQQINHSTMSLNDLENINNNNNNNNNNININSHPNANPFPNSNIYNNIPMQTSNSASNFDLYNNNNNNNNSQYSLLNSNLKSPQFLNQFSSSTPLSTLTQNSIPMLNQSSANNTLLQNKNLLPSSVSMTPQLSINSQIGLNDLNSPDLNNNNNNNLDNNNTFINTSFNLTSNSNSNNNSTYNLIPEVSSIPSRTVYLGNIPNGITTNELLNHVRSGTVESLKLIPSKNCAFISFLDEKSATLFHSDAILKRLTINNHDIKIGWGKPSPVQPAVLSCVQRYNATRNVYIGNLNDNINEDDLRNDFQEFGEIDTIKILYEKRIAFIHFTSILSAIKCVQSLPLNNKYKDNRIFYGKDRCAFITKTQQHNAAQYLGLNPNVDNFLNQVDRDLISNALVQQSNAAAMIATSTGGNSNLGNRTIYLGNLHPDSTIEEICNVVRGGILQNIRLINDRHVCFITFIDPISAAQFYAMSSLHGLIIHNRKIKVGWGKHSGPLPNLINLAVGNGASRNIYIGGLDKISDIKFNKDKLYLDFKEFGEIEQINFFEERHCCFVNFTNISNAIKAIDGIRNNFDYQRCKINFGKDRCGNTPRQYQISNNNNNNNRNPHNDDLINGIENMNLNNNNNNNNHHYPYNNNTSNVNDIFNNGYTTNTNKGSEYEDEDDEEEDDEDDYIDESKVKYQPLGIILQNSQNNIM